MAASACASSASTHSSDNHDLGCKFGETFVATVLGAFAAFWISYAALVIGLAHNWYAIPPTAIQHAGAVFVLVFAALGYYGYLGTAIVSVGGKPLPFGKPALSLLSGK